MPLSLCSTSTQTHHLLQKPLISPQLLLAGDLSVHFENAVNSKLFRPQHNWVTTPFPADTFLVFSPTNKICEEKAKTENLISPQQSQPSHWRSPSELLCHLVCSPLTALHHHRCTPRTNSRGAPGGNWFRSSGGWEGLPTTNSHLWPRCTATNGRPRQICFLARGNLCRPTTVEDKDIREMLRFFVMMSKIIDFPPKRWYPIWCPLIDHEWGEWGKQTAHAGNLNFCRTYCHKVIRIALHMYWARNCDEDDYATTQTQGSCENKIANFRMLGEIQVTLTYGLDAT